MLHQHINSVKSEIEIGQVTHAGGVVCGWSGVWVECAGGVCGWSVRVECAGGVCE